MAGRQLATCLLIQHSTMGNNNSKPNFDNDYQNANVKDSLFELNLTNERGVAFIISNPYLRSGKESHSKAVNADVKKMEELFQEKKINYMVKVRTAGTYKAFLATYKHLVSYEDYPKTCKTILLYFCGHGGQGFITMEDGTTIDILKLRSLSANNDCDIAKIFLIDACRGSESDSGHMTRTGGKFTCSKRNNSPIDHAKLGSDDSLHASKGNDLIAYATSDGYVAYSNEDGGSWTNTLVLQLRKLEHEDITSVLHKVNGLMRYKIHGPKKAPKFQTPEAIDRLTNKVYLWDQSGKSIICLYNIICIVACSYTASTNACN